ncbi:hypothetical protein [Caldisalinibacter kiritimatiensis]|uniref:Uncharacterized protein n=1 Tax=Caldisalinibacter kiritimatiensis TaxID=1304284 RepID=R1CLU8_9FIRM|nr:hypothetical protein [Caldisalinibacter kiritimatiensis]EOC99680.1 hypothetical protein L21TH_2323 [Caldisalinibacter kiritimatiensis]
MNKKRIISIGVLILAIVVFIIGLNMIFSSVNVGQIEGAEAIRRHGGSMSTDKYLIILESAIENHRTSGIIVSLIGGLGILLSGVGVYKEF